MTEDLEETNEEPTGYQSGYDIRTPAPGAHESMNCSTCGDVMNVTRNVNSATGWAEAMAKKGHLHDRFVCPNSGRKWHNQVIALMRQIDKTPSKTIADLLTAEKDEIMKTRKATKLVSLFD